MKETFRALLIVLLNTYFSPITFAADDDLQPIKINADEISFEQKEDKATALGKVSIIKGKTTLLADKVETFFVTTEKKHQIRLMKAFGSVRIENPEHVATSEKGTYDIEKDEIILEGNVVVNDHKNQVKGAYGILNKKTGITKVMNHLPGSTESPSKQVSALLMPHE